MHHVCNLRIYHNDQYRLYDFSRINNHTDSSDPVLTPDTAPSPHFSHFRYQQHYHNHHSSTTKKLRYQPPSRPTTSISLKIKPSLPSSHIEPTPPNHLPPLNSTSNNQLSLSQTNPIQIQLDLILAKLVDLKAIKHQV